MQYGMSISVSIERGEQLREFADKHGVPIGDIGLLLDHGSRTGLGNTLALPGIEIASKCGLVEIKLNQFALCPHSAAQARSFADFSQERCTNRPATLDLDCPDTIEVTRRGNGVVVRIQRNDVIWFIGPWHLVWNA